MRPIFQITETAKRHPKREATTSEGVAKYLKPCPGALKEDPLKRRSATSAPRRCQTQRICRSKQPSTKADPDARSPIRPSTKQAPHTQAHGQYGIGGRRTATPKKPKLRPIKGVSPPQRLNKKQLHRIANFVGILLACTVVAIFTTNSDAHTCASEAALPSPV